MKRILIALLLLFSSEGYVSGLSESFNLEQVVMRASAILIVEPKNPSSSTVMISDQEKKQSLFTVREILLQNFNIKVNDAIDVLPENTGMRIELEEQEKRTGVRKVPFIPEYTSKYSFKETEKRVIFITKFKGYYELVAQDGIGVKEEVLKLLEPAGKPTVRTVPHSGVKQKF